MIQPGYTPPNYVIPVVVALSRYEQRTKQTAAWLRQAAASLEHHATLPEYAHCKAELETKADRLREGLALGTIG